MAAEGSDVEAALTRLRNAARDGDVEALRLALSAVPRDRIDEPNDSVRVWWCVAC